MKGPKGELYVVANDEVLVKLEDNTVAVTPANDSKDARSKWGMSRTMIENIFKGVKDGYERSSKSTASVTAPPCRARTCSFSSASRTTSSTSRRKASPLLARSRPKSPSAGIDKQQVGQVAAEIREYRGPEPYKGKGVKYAGERIVRKEGKKK
jgi:large subunit ribosomal protein L6